MPADERPVDPGATIDVSHAGVDAVEEPLSELLAERAEREAVEARLLRAGPYAIGPGAGADRPRACAAAAPADGGPRATVDGAGDFDDVDPGAQVVPSLVAGTVDGLGRGRRARDRRRRPRAWRRRARSPTATGSPTPS